MARKTPDKPAEAPRPVQPAEPDKLDLLDEFAKLVTHYDVWRHVRLSYEDGQIDIGLSDYDRIQEIAGELGIRERGT